MATRNLARTVVEGGRAGHSSDKRRFRNRAERRLRFDAEGNVIAGKPQRSAYRDFADKLSPLRRWLDSQIGRGWTNVYREFCAMHDRRTLKGWHLFAHLIVHVGRDGSEFSMYSVDERGILRRRDREPWSREPARPGQGAAALAWANGRLVIVHGASLFWTARAVDPEKPATPQGRRLTPEESAFWSALPARLQDWLTYRKQS